MREQIKAIITDLDRTLLHSDKSLSEYTVSVLKECKEKGILVIAATARPERAIEVYKEQILFDAFVTLNGARTILPSGCINIDIPFSVVCNMLKNLESINDAVISLETSEGIFSNVDIPEWNPTVCGILSEAPIPQVVYKILVSSENADLTKFIQEILTENIYYTIANQELYQIMNIHATKWNGIKNVLKEFGITAEEVVYFGDDNDDLEPIKNCGLGIAVSNAIDAVKAVADEIIDDNDCDGVAHYIEDTYL